MNMGPNLPLSSLLESTVCNQRVTVPASGIAKRAEGGGGLRQLVPAMAFKLAKNFFGYSY